MIDIIILIAFLFAVPFTLLSFPMTILYIKKYIHKGKKIGGKHIRNIVVYSFSFICGAAFSVLCLLQNPHRGVGLGTLAVNLLVFTAALLSTADNKKEKHFFDYSITFYIYLTVCIFILTATVLLIHSIYK